MSVKPTKLYLDPVDASVVRLRTLLGVVESAAAARDCPVTREAVEEQEERGEVGCPVCGGLAVLHSREELR